MNWQPIETAPKDGTWVLLCGGETTEDDYLGDGVLIKRPVVAFWDNEGGLLDDGAWYFCYWDGDWRDGYDNPTHWMPLPEPPQSLSANASADSL